jgi:hypothetical protein
MKTNKPNAKARGGAPRYASGSGFAKLPRKWIDDPSWSRARPKHVKVLVTLLGTANWRASTTMDGTVVPANAKMIGLGSFAAFCGVSISDLRGALKHWASRSVLTYLSTSAHTIVTFVDRETYEFQGQAASSGGHTEVTPASSTAHTRVTTEVEGRTNKGEGRIYKDVPSSAGACEGKSASNISKRRAYDRRFEAFWALYPRKVGKVAAAEEFDLALKGGTSSHSIIDGIRKLAPDLSRVDEQRYIPHPAKWLHDGRWTDEDT